MRIPTIIAVAALIGATPAVAQQSGDSLAVAEAAIATSVVDREPQGGAESFPADVGQLYCWTSITNAGDSTAVEHVWYHGDEEVARMALTARGERWRTWSRKTIPSDRTGEWRVDVVGPGGAVLRSVRFTVQ